MKKIYYKLKSFLKREQSIEQLIDRGLKVGKGFKRMGGCIIDSSHCWHIEIGDEVTFAPGVQVLAHDASTKTFLGYTKVANVKIGNRVFIGAGTIILSGVTIGDDVIVGAGSVITTDIPEKSVAVGCPAKVSCSLDHYLDKEKACMTEENVFDSSYTLRNQMFSEKHIKMLLAASDKYKKIYVE